MGFTRTAVSGTSFLTVSVVSTPRSAFSAPTSVCDPPRLYRCRAPIDGDSRVANVLAYTEAPTVFQWTSVRQ